MGRPIRANRSGTRRSVAGERLLTSSGRGWTVFPLRYVAMAVALTLLAACSTQQGDDGASAATTAQSAAASAQPSDQATSAAQPNGPVTGPEDAAREYFEAGMTLDKDRALAVICSADQDQFQEAEPIAAERITAYSIGASREVLGGLAQVTVDFQDASGTTDTVEVPVLEEADGWKVCFSEGYRLPGA